MLLALAQWLQNDYSFLRVVNYLTFRAVAANLTALVIGLGFGPWVIRRLTELKIQPEAKGAFRVAIGRLLDHEGGLLKTERICARVVGPQVPRIAQAHGRVMTIVAAQRHLRAAFPQIIQRLAVERSLRSPGQFDPGIPIGHPTYVRQEGE